LPVRAGMSLGLAAGRPADGTSWAIGETESSTERRAEDQRRLLGNREQAHKDPQRCASQCRRRRSAELESSLTPGCDGLVRLEEAARVLRDPVDALRRIF